ncbi:DHA2 family efflux MFS transporter permease subunit [Microbacterium sp. 13-71-7]|uniref:DHA2 family efflux MFS transporter permease subunit n=1 Tax=Microbacterium sp. 13-71-7 TaxID=1970399 RepID=UPI000BCBA3C4|nr:DHA2 family efflux MFS transporter permease subunit [Microbacterium sp. 13-71-7]OZB82572.1 MAG: hypothetical protein B7X32_13185 [Microbacterium sp. 13-71-7]
MRAPWLIVATVCVGAFMGQLDASIVTVAIPAMRSDLHASIDEVEWVALVYLLVLVGTIAAVGRVSDMFGRKLLYIYGFVLFTAASLACAVASNIEWLLLARVFQAIGAAMLQANSVALIRTNVPNTSLGRAIGLQGAAQAIGLALGPSVGGLLVGLGGWRWVFFVNIPAGILGVGLAWFLLPRTKVKARRTRLDWWGLITLLPGIGLLLWTLSAASRGQALNPSTGIALVAGVLLLAAFVWIEHHVANPLVDLDLFRSPAFSRGILTGLLCYLVLFGVLFVFPLYLVEGLALTAAAAGLVLTVLPAALGAIAPLAGRVTDRVGPALPTTVGMALTAAALAIAAFAPLPLWALGVVLLIIGIGLGLFTPANNATVAAAGPAHHAGMVSAVLNMTRGFGTSLGVAVAAAAYTLGSTASHSDSQSGFHIAVTVLAIIAAVAALVCLTQLPRRTRRA